MDYSRMKYWNQGGREREREKWRRVEYVREVKNINMYVLEHGEEMKRGNGSETNGDEDESSGGREEERSRQRENEV